MQKNRLTKGEKSNGVGWAIPAGAGSQCDSLAGHVITAKFIRTHAKAKYKDYCEYCNEDVNDPLPSFEKFCEGN